MAEVEAADAAAAIRALGRQGMGRAEIAAALGLSLHRLDAWESAEPAVAAALAVADAAARAWWAGRQREALLEGARVNAGAWREAMAWRFGAPGKGGAAAIAAPSPRATYRIPCNLRTKLLPDGTCPCSGVHDADWLRRSAGLRAWVIAGNDQNDFDEDEDEAWEREDEEMDEDDREGDEGGGGAGDVDHMEDEER